MFLCIFAQFGASQTKKFLVEYKAHQYQLFVADDESWRIKENNSITLRRQYSSIRVDFVVLSHPTSRWDMLCEFATEDENTHHLKKKNKNSVFKIKQGKSQNSCEKKQFSIRNVNYPQIKQKFGEDSQPSQN